jgi:hypothetical protein
MQYKMLEPTLACSILSILTLGSVLFPIVLGR